MFNQNNGQDLMAPIVAAATNAQVAAPAVPTGINATPAPAMAPIAAAGGPAAPSGPGFFQQGGGAQMTLGAVQTLGSLWNSFQQQKMAKRTFNLQEEAYRTNLSNQKSTYNSALEDRIRSRYVTEGKTSEAADKTIADRSL